MKRFLLGSAVLMLVFYVMAVPFVQYYNALDNPVDSQMEHALVMEIQMTNAIAAAFVFLVFLAAVWIHERYRPRL